MGLFMIESNILIYTYDVREQPRQARSLALLEGLGGTGSGRLFVQYLREFFSRITHGSSPLLNVSDAANQTSLLSATFTVHPVTSQIV